MDDIEILNCMINKLTLYKIKKIDLSVLVSDLESLFHSIKSIDEKWDENFLDQFSILESINAEVPENSKGTQKIIMNAILDLENLVNKKINQ